jgi:hypothetical protein
MSDLSRMEEVEQQFDHLAQVGAYAEALDLVTREAYVFPALRGETGTRIISDPA